MILSRSEDVISATEADAAFELLQGYDCAVLAVSGGPDSLALLVLADAWRKRFAESAPALSVATVDHKLREQSAAEAAAVAKLSAALGLPHATLVWEAQKPASGLPNAARNARYALLAGHAARNAAGAKRTAIVTAHTQDDQAETVFMRLARGGGVRALSAMRPVRPLPIGSGDVEIDIVRPLLGIPKRRLVATLEAQKISYADDPTNLDPAFERTRIRAALAASGIDPGALARTAKDMQETLAVIAFAKVAFASAAHLSFNGGIFASCDRAVFDAAPRQLADEILRHLVLAFGGATPAPERSEIARLAARIRSEKELRATLGGAVVSAGSRTLRVWREPGRLVAESLPLKPGETLIWDARFRIGCDIQGAPPVHVRPLGEAGYRAIAETVRKAHPLPTAAAFTLPAFFRGDALIAVPLLGVVLDHTAERFTCSPLPALRDVRN